MKMTEKVEEILKIVADFHREFQNSSQFPQRSCRIPKKDGEKCLNSKKTENMLKLAIESKKTYKKQLDI